MLRGVMQTLRFGRSWKNASPAALEDIEIERDGVTVPGTFATPPSHRGGLPGWIILGGVTRMGRFHPQLAKFMHALASSGAGVMVPEVPEWRDLKLSPGVAVPTVKAAVRALDARPEVNHGRYGLVGFSFGAPQAMIASSHPELTNRIEGVLSFGGYCSLERTLRCQLTGLHEWEGVTRRIEPDPFGRWVIASNHLTGVPGCEDADDVAAALRCLAYAASEQRVPGWDPRHDALKAQLRARLDSRRQELFDLFAPLASLPQIGGETNETMAVELAAACRRSDPRLDPMPELGHARRPVHLFHGRGDRLVPYTESLRFHGGLPAAYGHVTVTGLFAHSVGHRPPAIGDRLREGNILFQGLRRVLGSVS